MVGDGLSQPNDPVGLDLPFPVPLYLGDRFRRSNFLLQSGVPGIERHARQERDDPRHDPREEIIFVGDREFVKSVWQGSPSILADLGGEFRQGARRVAVYGLNAATRIVDAIQHLLGGHQKSKETVHRAVGVGAADFARDDRDRVRKVRGKVLRLWPIDETLGSLDRCEPLVDDDGDGLRAFCRGKRRRHKFSERGIPTGLVDDQSGELGDAQFAESLFIDGRFSRGALFVHVAFRNHKVPSRAAMAPSEDDPRPSFSDRQRARRRCSRDEYA